MNESMLPEGYSPPKEESSYLSKFEEGTTKIRPLEKVMIGWVGWIEGQGDEKDKPEYFPENEKPSDASKYRNGLQEVWFFPVWNHDAERVQICTITQNSIKRGLWSIFQNWGLPYSDTEGYDIIITREGTTFENTKYTVQPAKPSDLSDEVKAEIAKYEWKMSNQFIDSEDAQTLIRKENADTEEKGGEHSDEEFDEIEPEDIPDIAV